MAIRDVTRYLAMGIAAGAIAVAAQPALALDGAGSLEGVVKNAAGQPVTGAFVRLKNADKRLTFMTAIKAAAVQQRLMVAALSCDAAQLYNRFVTSYQRELQASDRALQNFFRRLNGKTGTEDYHAFKTRLANASSMA